MSSLGNGELFASASKANHVAFFIVVSDRALRTGDISANQNRVFLPARIDVTTGYQLGPNGFVQLAALVVCRVYYQDERAGLMRDEGFSGYLSAARFSVSDLPTIA